MVESKPVQSRSEFRCRSYLLTWMVILGFASGLPFLITLQTLQVYLRDSGISLETLGYLGLSRLPYALKFLWAPWIDTWVVPFLRKGFGYRVIRLFKLAGKSLNSEKDFIEGRLIWAVQIQILMSIFVFVLSILHVQSELHYLAGLCVLINFLSASLDVALDGHRRNLFRDEELGLATSFFVNGYRLGLLVASSGALIASSVYSWDKVWQILALLLFILALVTLFAPRTFQELNTPLKQNAWFERYKEAVLDLRQRFMWPELIGIVLLILFYKLGDQWATALSFPFYKDLGFSNETIGAVAKISGTVASIVGSLVGGIVLLRISIVKALQRFGLGQGLSIIAMWALAVLVPRVEFKNILLGTAVFLEYFLMGLGTAAFTSFMAAKSSSAYAGTQLAIGTSLMQILSTSTQAFTGVVAEQVGWANYFLFCFVLGLPGIYFAFRLKDDDDAVQGLSSH